MKVIRPITITNNNLISSTIADVDSDTTLYSSATTYALNDKVTMNDNSIAVTMTIADPAVITWASHELIVGMPISFTTTGALPTGLLASTTYFISKIVTTSTFEVSEIVGGVSVRTSGAQSGTHTATLQWHRVYQSLQASNTANNPRKASSAAWWQEIGASNKWAMFDGSITSQSVGTTITVRIRTPAYFDTVALLNVKGGTYTITTLTSALATTYTTGAVSLTSSAWPSDPADPYAITGLTQTTEQLENVFITGLNLNLANSYYVDITIAAAKAASMSAIGACLVGNSAYFGSAVYGASVGIQDYSVIEQDEFGNYSIVPRTFSKKGSFTVYILATIIDKVFELLTRLRATPALYMGSSGTTATVIYGFPSEWSIVLEQPTYYVLNIEIKGLT